MTDIRRKPTRKRFLQEPEIKRMRSTGSKKACPTRSLRKFDTAAYDEECLQHWKNNRFHLLSQDKRITDDEWEFIAKLMTRLFGQRAML